MIFASVVVLSILGCKTKKQEPVEVYSVNDMIDEIVYHGDYMVFGEDFSPEGALSKEEMMSAYSKMAATDTLAVKFESTINDICPKKGCWMSMDLGNEQENFVRFVDYGFFVPKDAHQKKTVVNGKAFIKEESVERQRHYAQDAGKSQEEIEKITEPKRTLFFMASGVLIDKY